MLGGCSAGLAEFLADVNLDFALTLEGIRTLAPVTRFRMGMGHWVIALSLKDERTFREGGVSVARDMMEFTSS